MTIKWRQAVLAVVGILLLGGVAAHAQFDIGGSGYEAFTQSTTGQYSQQKPANGAGGILEMRYLYDTFRGGEVTYSFNTANQAFSPTAAPGCGYFCANQPVDQKTALHTVTMDWVVSKRHGNLRPFAVAGLGFFVFVPQTNDQSPPMNTLVRMGYVYGAGTDWNAGEHWGVRLQVRGNLYKAPAIALAYPPTGKFTQSIEPAAGIFYRF